MAFSDQLAKLAVRAKNAEIRATEAHDKAKAELEQDVSAAREATKEQAERLRATADASEEKISDGWSAVQSAWTDHVAAVRSKLDTMKVEHKRDEAERRAENAEDDALFAIDFAYSAIEEAEYAVLDATLARMEADDVSASSGAAA
jgi:hypothetical protein